MFSKWHRFFAFILIFFVVAYPQQHTSLQFVASAQEAQPTSEQPVATGTPEQAPDLQSEQDPTQPAETQPAETPPPDNPTAEPTEKATGEPTDSPTDAPTSEPVDSPTDEPSDEPTDEAAVEQPSDPTEDPTDDPTEDPTDEPTEAATDEVTTTPEDVPEGTPTELPSDTPAQEPTDVPAEEPTESADAPPATFKPSFNVSPQQGNAPLTVNVSDTTSGNPTSWSWNFGDGSGEASGSSASHTYNQPGTYTITLTVSNDTNSGQATRQVVVSAAQASIQANFDVQYVGARAVPQAVQFNNNSTGDITKHEWDFNGDGTVDSTATSPSFTYNAVGNYTVSLTVTGSNGQTSTAVRTVSIVAGNVAPVAAFRAEPATAQAPATISFIDESQNTISQWLWTFHDGSTASSQNAQFTYNTPGTYTVTLQVTGPGGSNSTSRDVVITQPGFSYTCTFERAPATGVSPLNVAFDADISMSAGGQVTSVTWDFGNGQSASGSSVSMTYSTDESTTTYDTTMTATISDSNGGSYNCTKVRDVTVYPATAINAVCSVPDSARPNQSITASERSIGNNITSWQWTWGDGNSSSGNDHDARTHAYANVGSYDVYLQVTNGDGGSDSQYCGTVVVSDGVQASFSGVPSEITIFDEFTPSDTSQGDIVSWAWDFGDGTTSGAQNPGSHAYTAPGQYTVSLTVGSATDSDTATRTVTALNNIFADFEPDDGFAVVGQSIGLIDESTGPITSWSWDWGDGSDSVNRQNPGYHAYRQPGTYTISLTINNDLGFPETTTRDVQVVPALNPRVSVNPSNATAPQTVTFSGQTDQPTSSWRWAFSNGWTASGQSVSLTFDEPGTYTATLTVAGPAGEERAQGTVTLTSGGEIRAAFSPSQWNGIAPLTVSFSDQSVGDGIHQWAWDFNGDGNIDSSIPNPSYTFNSAGTYNVRLTVTGDAGSASASNSITVYDVNSSSASFSVDYLCDGEVTFSASSGVDVLSWDFGDGDVGTAESDISHVYASGDYTATMIYAGPGGASLAVSRSINVENNPCDGSSEPISDTFDPTLGKGGWLPEGSLGLPGQPVVWEITVGNNGNVPGTGVRVRDQINDYLQVMDVRVPDGRDITYTVDGQRVDVIIPVLERDNPVVFYIDTVVVTSPESGLVNNMAALDGNGLTAWAEVKVAAGSEDVNTIIIQAEPPSLPDGPDPNISGLPYPASIWANEQACFTARFTNSGTNPGFGPYLRVLLPPELILDSADFINTPQSIINVGTFTGPGNQLTDPISEDNVIGTTGWQFFVIRYPIGSVVTGNPPLDMEMCLSVDESIALIGITYPFEIIPGYEFGDTATGDNGPIVDTDDPGKDGAVELKLVEFEKDNSTPEDERPPGPVWEYEYYLTTTLAPGQRLTDIAIVDTLDADWQFTSFDGISGTCNAVQAGAPSTPAAPPPPVGGGTITVNFSEIENTGSNTCTVVITYSGYILDILTEDGTIDPDEEGIVNVATFDSSWTGNDDLQDITVPELSDTNTVLVDNMVFQKSVSPGTSVPETDLAYTINFQITQFDSISAAVITDTIPNGISTDYDSYRVRIGGSTYPVPNTAITHINNADGTITVSFDLEDATDIPIPLPSSGDGQIQYDGVIDVYYRDSAGNPNTDEPIRASDSMTNTVTGDFVLSSGMTQSNDSSATVDIIPVTISKQTLTTINPPENAAGYSHGEDVTFRLTMNIPSGDTRGIVFRDFLPLPVFDIDDPDLGFEVPAGPGPFTVPVQNTSNVCYQQFNLGDNDTNCGITWGPDATIFPQIESFNLDGATNSLEIVFEDINTSGAQTIQIDLTVAVIDNPFADGLFLSNQFESEVQNTPGTILPLDAISYLNLSAPHLEIIKGVVDSSNSSVVISPAATGGAVDADSDGDASGFDANDQVTYAITVTNTGGAPAYDVLVGDDTSSLTGLENCVVDTVTTETGTSLTYTGSLPAITLTSPIAPSGQAVVRLTCETTDIINPNQNITNTATADYNGLPILDYTYNSAPIAYPQVSDTAEITMRDVEIAKSVAPTSATIGETVTYTVTVTLPGGEIDNLQVQDVLPAGMAFVDCTSVTPSGSTAVVTNLPGGFADACNAPINPTIAGSGTTITFDLGDVSVSSPTGNADVRTLDIVYTAVVLDVGTTEGLGGTTTDLTNTVTQSSDDTDDHTDQATLSVIEPELTISKEATPDTGDAGDTIDYVITVEHTANSNADAYDLVVTDVIPAGMTFDAFGTISPTPSVAASYNGTDTITVRFDALTTSQTATIRYSVTLDNDVEAEQQLTNDVGLSYDSHPDDDLTDVSPYTDPTDRERDYTDTTDDTVTIVPFLLDKTVTSTSEVATTGLVNVAIGERVTYTVTVDVPEGVHDNVVLVDTLDSGLAFADLSATGGISSINFNGVTSSRTTTQILNDADTSVTLSGRQATFNFGTLTNNAALTDGVDRTSVTLVYEVVVLDSSANNRGNTRNNSANLTYDNGGDVTDSAPNVRIVEPTLQINKTANPATGDSGDAITFTMVISHTTASNATAFDIALEDVIPTGMTYVAASLTNTGGVAPATLTESGGTITATWDSLTTAQTSTLEFQATLDGTVSPGSTITNTADITDYDSLAGDNIDDGLSPYIPGNEDSERDYTTSDTADVEIANLTMDKTITATSETATTGNDVAIGEVISYRLAFGVPEGVTTNVTLMDTLDAGLAFADMTNATINFPSGVTSSVATPTILSAANTSVGNCNGGGCSVTFDFGTLTNSNTSGTISRPEIVITYDVVVLDIAGNTRGTDRGNAAMLDYDTAPVDGISPVSPPQVTIVEPGLQVVKTASPTTGDAGDEILFTLVISHIVASDATAFDIALEDVIPAGVTYVAASLTNTAGIAPATLAESGGTITATWDSLTTAQSSTITFRVTLDDATELDQVITNTADITDYDTLVADDVTDGLSTHVNDGTDGERDYNTNDTANVTITNGNTITKSVTSTSHTGTDASGDSQHDLTIGEEVSYELVVTFREGTSDNVRVEDVYPAGVAFDFISASVTAVGGNLTGITNGALPTGGNGTAGTPLYWDFGTVVNTADNVSNTDDQITITIVLRVDDNVANDGTGTNDKNQSNTATVRYEDYQTNAESDSDTATIDVVEPELSLTKTRVTTPGPFEAGDTIEYRITLEHTAQSTANAYDIVVTDTLPTEVSLVGLVGASTTCASVTPSFTAPTLTLTIPSLSLATDSCDIVYEVTVGNDVEPSSTYTNTAGSSYSTLPGTPTDDRTKNTSDDTATFDTPNPTITKAATSTSHADTGTGADSDFDLAIGEQVTYTLTVTMPEGTTDNVRVIDLLPQTGVSFEYISSQIATIGTGITLGSGSVGTAGSYAAGAETVTWTLGTVTNPPGNGDTLTFEILARVNDVAANVGLVTDQDVNLVNTGRLIYEDSTGTDQTLNDTETVDLVEPELSLAKTRLTTPGPFEAGDTIQYRITLDHTAQSTTNAYDIVVTDTLPTAGMGFVGIVGGSTTCASVTPSFTSPTITFSIPSITLASSSCDIVYEVTVGNDVEPSSSYTNTAGSSYSTLPGTPTDDRTKNTSNDTATFQTASPTITKSVTSTSHADTGTGADSDFDLAIGEEVTYTLTVTLPEGTTDNVRVIDLLPQTGVSFEYISSEIATVGTGITLGSGSVGTAGTYAAGAETVTWTLGTVTNPPGNGDTLTFEIVARVNDVAANVGLVTGQDVNLVNTGRLIYEDSTGADQTLNDTDTVDLVEPELSLTKARVTTPNPFDAGDSIQYTLTLSHTAQSTANAYDIVVTDVFPTTLTSFASVDGGTCTVSATNTSTAGQVGFTVAQLNLGATCTITYSITVGVDVEPGTTYTNTASAVYSSLPGTPADDRTNTTPNDTATFTTPGPSITKAVFGTSDAGNQNYAIGELVTYHIIVTLTEGTTRGVTVSDAPPSGTATLTPISMSVLGAVGGTDTAITTTGANLSATDTAAPLSINFGDVTNPAGGTNQIVLEVIAQVTDDVINTGLVGNQDTNVTNTATLAYTDGNDAPQTENDTAQINFIEPELTLAKDNQPTGVPVADGGDTLQFRITLTHTANSLADAHNIVVTDVLPTAGMSYNPATGIVGASTTCVGVTSSFASPNITFNVPTLALATNSCDIVYSVTVGTDVQPSSTYTNVADADYDSSTTVDDRTKSTNSDDAEFTTPGPQLVKRIVSTSLADTTDGLDLDPDVAIGEIVTFELEATMAEGTSNNVSLVDTLPATFTVVDSEVYAIGSNISGSSLTVGTAGTVAGNQVTFNFGNIVNMPDGVTTAADRIVVRIDARLTDDPSNADGQTKTNTGQLNYTDSTNAPQSLSDTDDIDVVEPALVMTKAFSEAQVVRGSMLNMVLTVTNNGTAPAYDIVVNDIFAGTNPTGDIDLSKVRINSVTVTSEPSGANTNTSSSVTGTYGTSQLIANIARLMPTETVVLTVNITIDPTATPVPLLGTDALDNTATVDYDSTPDDAQHNDASDRDYDTNANDTLEIIIPTITVTKVDDVDPVNAGGIVIYTITVENTGTPDVPANDVIVTDTLPTPTDGVTVVLVTPSQGTCGPVVGGQLTCSLGTLLSGANATITVRMRVDAANRPQQMTNNVNVTTRQGNDEDADETTDIVDQIDLELDKVVSQTQPAEGDTITYTLTASNNGPSDATNVVVTDTLPSGLTYVQFIPNTLPCVFTDPTLTCTFPTLDALDFVEVGIQATVDTGAAALTQPIVNAAAVIADESGGAGYPDETDNTNNEDTAPITVTTVDLAVVKSVTPTAPSEGDIVTYTIQVTNNGPANATGVVVTDTLPAGLTYVSNNSASTGTTYAPATGEWAIGDLTIGASIQLEIRARVNAGTAGTQITNTASLTDVDQTDRDPTNNSDDAVIVVDGLDLEVIKTVNNTIPQEGDTITYSILLRNLGAANGTGITVTDDLNGVTGITYVSHTAPGSTSYNPATGLWTVGSLNANQSLTLTVVATVDAGAAALTQPIINNAAVSAVDQTDVNPDNDDDDAAINVLPLDLAVTKVVDNNTPVPGEQITYTITVINNGPANATGVVISDALDANLTFISAAPIGVYDSVTGLWTIGNLNAGVNQTLTIVAQVNGAATTGTVIPNVAAVQSVDQTDSDPTNDQDDAPATVGGLDLVVTKVVDDATPREGDTINYTITVENLGAANATGVIIEDIVPAGVTFVSSSATVGSYNSVSNLWTVGPLAVTQTASLIITATVDNGTSGTTIDNIATLNSVDQPDADPDNNQDNASITVEAVDLAITKVVDNAGPSQGDTVTYTITVTNLGEGDATGVVVTEDLPADGVSLSLLNNTPSQGSFTLAPPNSTWAVGDLAANASAILTLTVRVEVPNGLIVNTVTVTGDQPDPDTSNNEDQAAIALNGTDLAVTKVVDNDVPFHGDQIVYTIVASNLGPNDATGVYVDDILPAGLDYVSDDSGGSFNSTTGDWTIGDLASGASATLNITVTVIDTSGSITNTAEIIGDQLDPNLDNNTDVEEIIVGGADLSLTKVRLVSGTKTGDLVTYVLTVVNDGPNPVSGVEVTDYMPEPITYESATPSKGTVSSPPDAPVIWSVGDLAIGEFATLTINGRINDRYGSTTNVAEVTDASLPDIDSTPGNRAGGEDDMASTTGPVVNVPPPAGASEEEMPESVSVPGIGGAFGQPVCSYSCVSYQFYHTNRDGNWEIYRLGDIPGQPDANPNLTQGTGEGIDDIAPSRSPNGEWIAFASNRDGNWEIYVGSVDGTEQRRVTYNNIAIDTDPVWGPTNAVVYESSRDGNWNLYMIDMTTGTEVRLTDDDASDLNASWAPSGDRIIFQSDRSGTWQIYELNLTTDTLRVLSDGNGQDFDPQYSPDGQQIVFRSYRGDADDTSVLYVMNRNGGNVRAISDNAGNATNASWSPDRNLIAYQSDINGDLDVFVHDLTTGQTRQVTDNDIDDYAPTWLCSTTHILFTSDIDGDPNIYEVDAAPMQADPVSVEDKDEVIQRTDSTFDDIYPEGAPTEENASREGRLPDVGSLNYGTQTDYLPVDTSVTRVDTSSQRGTVWQPINGCGCEDCLSEQDE
ncbi:MAG: hypothetical protein CL607_12720 [Anaerolineaceae bacterium]|nr:hypothetical protein [Anaerolineaceae bacterium]